jgi:hypothetical protein
MAPGPKLGRPQCVIAGCNRIVQRATRIELCGVHVEQWRAGTLDVGEKASFQGLGRLLCGACGEPLVRHAVARRCPFLDDAMANEGVVL